MSRKRAAGGSASSTNARQRAAAAAQVAQRKRDRRILAIVAIGIAVVLIGGGIGFQAWRTSRTPTVAPSASAASPTPVTLESGKPVVFGSANAPVTLSLYEDFHCPACEQFQQAYDAVLTEAEDDGDLKTEFYPLKFHDTGSPPAANAFACAAQAGFGRTYYHGLFANFTLQWSDDQLISLAQQINGSVPDSFRTCVTSKANQAWVDSITATADRNGVTGTPTVFLDGQPVDLSQVSPDVLRSRIAEAAKK